MPKLKTVRHSCFDQADQNLLTKNTRLSFALAVLPLSKELLIIKTEKVDEEVRGKPTHIFATYCPFCGAKL